MAQNNEQFVLMESDLIPDRFLVITKRAGLKPARLAHPGLVIFHIKEFDTMEAVYPDRKKRDAAFKKLYKLKKEFDGWLLPVEAGKLKFKWGKEDA